MKRFISPILVVLTTFVWAVATSPPPPNVVTMNMPTVDNPPRQGAPNPCNTSPETDRSCWDCYQNLMDDCDGQQPSSPVRREACYSTAQLWWVSCNNRVHPTSPVTPARSTSRSSVVTPGGIFTVSAENRSADRAEVYILACHNAVLVGDMVSDLEGNFTFDGPLNPAIDFCASAHVAVIVRFYEQNTTVGVSANSADIDWGFDINRNGALDTTDLFGIIDQVGNGTRSQEDLFSFLDTFFSK